MTYNEIIEKEKKDVKVLQALQTCKEREKRSKGKWVKIDDKTKIFIPKGRNIKEEKEKFLELVKLSRAKSND